MKFGVIYMDPPWPESGTNPVGVKTSRIGARAVFPVMNAKSILSMRVQDVAADSCVLFLWCTPRHVPLAVECFNAWGFRWATTGFVWVKMQKDGITPKFGLGSYTRGSTELCFIGARGTGTLPAVKNVRQVIQTVPGEFAEKPEEVRKEIERMYPDRNRLEMFARRNAKGWTTTGNQLDGMDIHEYIRRLSNKKER